MLLSAALLGTQADLERTFSDPLISPSLRAAPSPAAAAAAAAAAAEADLGRTPGHLPGITVFAGATADIPPFGCHFQQSCIS